MRLEVAKVVKYSTRAKECELKIKLFIIIKFSHPAKERDNEAGAERSE